MSGLQKVLVTIIVLMLWVVSVEIAYFYGLPRKQVSEEPIALACPTQIPTPSLALDADGDQSYRLPDAPNRLTRFLTNATYDFITELAELNPIKKVDVSINSKYEGSIDSVLDAKEAQKIYKPDPKHPQRTVVAVIQVSEGRDTIDTKKIAPILLVESEMKYLTIQSQDKKEYGLKDLKGKKVTIERIIELPVAKGTDIVRLAPIVRTNITVLK